MNTNNELYHHGVLGMKWGIRRYQNYDGTYTKKGMARYRKSLDSYNKSKSAVKAAKDNYKTGIGTKNDIKRAKTEKHLAKRQLDRDYKQLAKDKRADQGREIYNKGRTILGNNKTVGNVSIVEFGAGIATYYLASTGNISLAKATLPIAVGSGIAASILSIKGDSENKKLRAYYSHSRTPSR